MQSMQIHARVGSDGILRLTVPFETHEADADVLVTIEPVREPAVSASGEHWGGFLSDNFGPSEPLRPATGGLVGRLEAADSRCHFATGFD